MSQHLKFLSSQVPLERMVSCTLCIREVFDITKIISSVVGTTLLRSILEHPQIQCCITCSIVTIITLRINSILLIEVFLGHILKTLCQYNRRELRPCSLQLINIIAEIELSILCQQVNCLIRSNLWVLACNVNQDVTIQDHLITTLNEYLNQWLTIDSCRRFCCSRITVFINIPCTENTSFLVNPLSILTINSSVAIYLIINEIELICQTPFLTFF